MKAEAYNIQDRYQFSGSSYVKRQSVSLCGGIPRNRFISRSIASRREPPSRPNKSTGTAQPPPRLSVARAHQQQVTQTWHSGGLITHLRSIVNCETQKNATRNFSWSCHDSNLIIDESFFHFMVVQCSTLTRFHCMSHDGGPWIFPAKTAPRVTK